LNEHSDAVLVCIGSPQAAEIVADRAILVGPPVIFTSMNSSGLPAYAISHR
jgi:hypothetical protein